MNIRMKDISYNNGKVILSFQLEQCEESRCEYAYYLYQDECVIQRIWYSECKKTTEVSFQPTYNGTYKFRLFVRKNNVIIFNELTNSLSIDSYNKKLIETTFDKKEKVFFSNEPVKYLFERSNEESKYLIISFSGLYSTEFQGGLPVYNHIRTLKSIKAHKLFILDAYKSQFCYYVGFGGSYDFESSVIALITAIAGKYNISPENIIATGSSKGGTAALYYSLKYKFGKAIIGAPQVYIAQFLDKKANSFSMRKRFENLIGDNEIQGKKFWNDLILNQVALNDNFPELHFHVGKGDYHYKEHLKVLLKELNKKKVPYQLELLNYQNHNDTGIYFRPFLFRIVKEITTRKSSDSIALKK